MRKLFLLYILIITGQLYAQKVGEWSTHYSYKEGFKLLDYTERIYSFSEIGAFYINKSDNSIIELNNLLGLSNIGLSAVAKLDENNSFIIGYSNGNIDIVRNDVISNIPDLKNKSLPYEKVIRSITISNGLAYCSLSFGILVINIDKEEVKETYYFGDEGSRLVVNKVLSTSDFIFACTEKGVYKANIESADLGNSDSWELISSKVNYIDCGIFNNKLFAIAKDGNKSIMYSQKDSSWEFVSSFDYYNNWDINDNDIYIITNSKIFHFNESFALIETISNYNSEQLVSFNVNDFSTSNEEAWILDRTYGIVKMVSNEEAISYLPNGPYSNNSYSLSYSEGHVWSAGGDVNAAWNNQGILANFSCYYKKEWTSFSKDNIDQLSGIKDVLGVVPDPSDADHIYVNTWNYGVFEFDNFEFIERFTEKGTSLQNIDWAGPEYVRIGAMAFDSNNILWMENSEVANGIVGVNCSTKNKEWLDVDYESFSGLTAVSSILIDKSGYKWIIVPRKINQGLSVIDDNNTPLDFSDDRYRSTISASDESDSRNAGSMYLFSSKEGEVLTNNVYCIAEDRNGEIWLGTDIGVVTLALPHHVFDVNIPDFSRILVPLEDGEENEAVYLLDDEIVTCVYVDGANRKWLGTEKKGVFLVSEDGTKTILEFNIDNSILPSNTIKSLIGDDETGEIFIGTTLGLVSYKGTAKVENVSFKSIYAYPNPVRKDYLGIITIKGLLYDSNVKITDVSGRLVFETTSLGGQAIWDGKNFKGEKVKSGVYLVFVSSSDGLYSESSKILIMNK